MSGLADPPIAAALALTAVALVILGLLSLGRHRRRLVARLRTHRTAPARPHGVSPVVTEQQLREASARAPASVRRWLLANGFEAAPRRLAGLVGLGILAAAAAGLAAGIPALLALGLASVGVPALTLLFGRRRLALRMRRAEQQFPTVLGTIVRTLQSGLTLQDAMQLVAAEGPEPLRSEFSRILNDEMIGLTLPEACQRMAARLPFGAAEFFALIVAVQTETGGSIVTAMQNLSETTEANAALSEKITIAGQEARASAMIIGSLPVIVLAMLRVVQPEFVGVLFNTGAGLLALAVGAGLMLIGTLVMREMAKFDD